MTTPTITAARVRELHASGQIVYGYPRRGEVVVNGFMRYRASADVARLAVSLTRARLAGKEAEE